MIIRINSDPVVMEAAEAGKLMQRIWKIKGCGGIEQEEFYEEAWIAYWEAKVSYDQDVNGYEYWKYIYEHMLKALDYLKTMRNRL